METFKIEHFVTARNGIPFPWYNTLTPTESANIRDRLRKRLGLKAVTGETDLVFALAERRGILSRINAQDREFNLLHIMDAASIRSNDIVYINWYRFDKVDRMRVSDLAQCFDDIWYPSSDDIDIFDQSLLWVISVSHGGEVYVVDL